MAMRRDGDVQADLIVSWSDVPRSPGHAFYDRLQKVLVDGGFDRFVEDACQAYYAARMGAPSVPPGRYAVKVNMEGFKQIDMADLPLSAGEVRDLGRLTLSAGGVTETVNVTAEVTPVQTTSSALQKNLSGDLLTSVQVKGRDIFGMLKILPGVLDSKASRDFTYWDSGRYLSINGGNSLNKNTTIDGVPVGEEGGNGTTYITPNIDSVAEVNVISSGYTAENGRMASGQVSMVTKSGTNEFKGSAYYTYRGRSVASGIDMVGIDLDGTAFPGELDSIAQEVCENLLQPAVIGLDGDKSRVDMAGKREFFVCR